MASAEQRRLVKSAGVDESPPGPREKFIAGNARHRSKTNETHGSEDEQKNQRGESGRGWAEGERAARKIANRTNLASKSFYFSWDDDAPLGQTPGAPYR